MKDPVVIEPYSYNWPIRFNELQTQIVTKIGSDIHRIDHIGSTAVVGLAAKPIIDIQISVKDLVCIEIVSSGLTSLGFRYRPDNDDLTKKYFREPLGTRRTHIHVRQAGSWSEQFNLLFRDYLRTHEVDRDQYAKIKYELADRFKNQREQYVEAKTAIVWEIMKKANIWSHKTG
ncbi:GrpB family protein [Cohnella sp. JJ-181]|uniref:GrpB family protein n=1 Tax=Cohnella rhizoplanae TaxID=2974897 RepID=UPI00232C9BBE|nr:GrpB family protein [Cohnella sp. JJ-181]